MTKKIACMLAVLVILSLVVACDSRPEYWPTEGWRTSTPEEQNIDVAKLNEGIEEVMELGNEFNTRVDCMLVIRNGYIVLEKYHQTAYTRDIPRNLSTATESFTSALTGIAMEEGYIDSLEQKMVDFFPGRTIENLDSRKESITLEHLLTMTSGLEWKGYVDSMKMFTDRDSVQFALDLPMVADPGEAFQYCVANPQLLSAIIAQTTGRDTLDFAREFLFEPLGITEVIWDKDHEGIYHGGYGLLMTPRDAAKFGYLYLHNGVWDAQQIIPADFVSESIEVHNSVESSPGGYGYLWWIDTENEGFYAMGWFGSLIYVIPALDLVVVITSVNRLVINEEMLFEAEEILNEYFVGACK